MSFLEIMFLLIMAMFVVGLIGQALVDLTGMGRNNPTLETKDEDGD